LNLLKAFLVTCLLLIASGLEAKPIKRTNNFFSYKDPFNEIGYGINVAYMRNENQLAPQLGLYYARYFTNYLSLGVSYCGLYTKNYYNALSARISFRVFNDLVLSLKPGIYIKNLVDKNEVLYFFGFETAYQFKLSNTIGLGPMIDLHVVQDDFYIMGGFQMAFYF